MEEKFQKRCKIVAQYVYISMFDPPPPLPARCFQPFLYGLGAACYHVTAETLVGQQVRAHVYTHSSGSKPQPSRQATRLEPEYSSGLPTPLKTQFEAEE